MNEATIRAQVELQYALDRMSTPLHASRLSDATAAEDARCMAIIRAEIDRLTRERNEARAELERERMRLVACGVVAMSNTPESASKAYAMADAMLAEREKENNDADRR